MEQIEFEVVSNVNEQIQNVRTWKDTIAAAGSKAKDVASSIGKAFKGMYDGTIQAFKATQNALASFNTQVRAAGGGLTGMASVLKDKVGGALSAIGGKVIGFARTFSTNMAAAGGGTRGFAIAMKGAARSAWGMAAGLEGVAVALISTGIGAAIVALGVALAALVTYFKDTEKGQIAWAKSINSMNAVVGPFMHSVAALGEAVYKFFTFDFKGAAKTFSEAFSTMNEDIKTNTKNLESLNKLEEKLVKDRRDAKTKEKDLEGEIAALKNKANDSEQYSAKERKKFIDEAITKTKELGTVRKKIAEDELELEEKKAAQGDNTIEDNKRIVELKNAVKDATQRQNEQLNELQGTQRTINAEIKKDNLSTVTELGETYKMQADAFKKIINDESASMSNRRKKVKDLGVVIRSSYQERIAEVGRLSGIQIDAEELMSHKTATSLSKRIKDLGLSGPYAKAVKDSVAFRRGEESGLFDLTQTLAKKAAANREAHEKALQSSSKAIRENEINNMEAGYEKDIAMLNEKLIQKKSDILNNTNLTYQEQQEQIKYWTKDTNDKVDEINAAHDDKVKEDEEKKKEEAKQKQEEHLEFLRTFKEEVDAINSPEGDESPVEKAVREEQEKAEALRQQILDNTSLTEEEKNNLIAQLEEQSQARIAGIQDKFRKEKQDKDSKAAMQQAGEALQFGAQVANAAGEMLSDDAETQKALNIAGAVMNTAAGVMKATAQTGALSPFVIPSIIATGAMQIAKIEATPLPKPKKYALGGFINGAAHANGGVNIEAEGGEFIVNKRAMANPSIASAVQGFNQSGNTGQQAGGMITAERVAEIASQVVGSIDVSVSEGNITSTQKAVRVREDAINF